MNPWTTYGVYTPDLKARSFSGGDLETAKKYCYRDRVVCSERKKTYGFSFEVKWLGWGDRAFRFRRWGWWIGPVEIEWSRLTFLVADKIVWRKEDTDGKA